MTIRASTPRESRRFPFLRVLSKRVGCVLDVPAGGRILEGVSAVTAGIILNVLALVISAIIVWGAFVEQKRANASRDERVRSGAPKSNPGVGDLQVGIRSADSH
ncbi:MAG: hypothetical protein NVS2B8_14820 [Vulcanimicrobiaceae bacterium]